MNEIDKAKNSLQAASQTRRSVLAKFIADFSGGVSLNTMLDSGKTALALVSAGMDPTPIHPALDRGGHSTNRKHGSFFQMVPLEGKIENTLQKLPTKVIHITEGSNSDLFEEARKPAVINGNPGSVMGEKPSRIFYISVFSTENEPGEDIKHWFNEDKELKPAA